MLYLSQILGRPIFDAEGEKIAAIKDIIVRYGAAEDYPLVVGLVARYRRRLFFYAARENFQIRRTRRANEF